jgi:hypothetical protein
MKLLSDSQVEATEVCNILQKIMHRIEESNLHDIEKTSFVIFLSRLRNEVEVVEANHGV